jgi:YebC/PmpR family DNA-binding regulatory protein
MSGHSKWSTIKRKKGAEDAKRGKIFTRLARDITMAARAGGGDESTNSSLRLAVDKARAANMPKDNIKRAIQRGTGEGNEGGDALEAVTYEGYGPGGVAFLVDVLTDNKNRTLAEVKHAFTRSGGNLASAGSVAWQFEQKGFISIGEGADYETVFLTAAEAGAEDVEEEDESISIYTPREDVARVAEALRDAGFELQEFELTWVAKNEVTLSREDATKVMGLTEKLEELDDVENVSSNLDITDEILAAMTA